MCTAVILDVPSIQKFVFGNNKMRLNIGASHIVSKLYKLMEGEPMNISTQPDHWYKAGGSLPAVLYEGGGNVVVLFDDDAPQVTKTSEWFIEQFSHKLLDAYPGLQVAFGVGKMDLDEETFAASMAALHTDLKSKKNKYYSQTSIPIQSLSELCSFNLLPAAEIKSLSTDHYPISELGKKQWDAEVENRKKVGAEYSFLNEKIQDKYYQFSNELEELGQRSDKSYIAVVHIDGNSMGGHFIRQKKYTSLQFLSEIVNKHYKKVIRQVFETFIKEEVPAMHEEDSGYRLKKVPEEDRIHKDFEETYYLPFRPLLISGDDITFVAHGKLGIYLAEQILLELDKEEYSISIPVNNSENEKIPLHACAGIAIAGTKTPFYQVYNIAEELCSRAKKEAYTKNWDEPGSYLDFALISSSGMMKDFDDFLDSSYLINGKSAKGGPYPIHDGFKSLKIKAENMKKWSNKKRHELRSIIGGGKEVLELFVMQLGITEPKAKNILSKDADLKDYYDALELLDFYPFEPVPDEVHT